MITLTLNGLILNLLGSTRMTQFIQFSYQFHEHLHFSSSVRDRGFILDPVLYLSDHISSVFRSCFYYLRQLSLIRQSLSLHAIAILVHALIRARVMVMRSTSA